MKISHLLISYILMLCTPSYSQMAKTARVFLVKQKSVEAKIINNIALTKSDSLNFIQLPDDNQVVKLEESDKYRAISKNSILVLFFDAEGNRIQLSNVGVSSIIVATETVDPSTIYPERYYISISLKELLANKPSRKSIIEMDINCNDGSSVKRYFEYINGVEFYDFAGNPAGIWFPINMYSTSGEKTENGIQFSVMPIGFAVGGKLNVSNEFHLGLSNTFNYTMTTATNQNDESFFLQDITVGPLLDLGGWAYLGYTWPINLTNNEIQLDSQFVLGVGIKLTKLLIGK